MIQLQMVRRDLEDLPPVDIASGDEVRQVGVEALEDVFSCLADAFPEVEWTRERTVEWLLGAADVWTTFVLVREGRVIATSACRSLADRPQTGCVHWVGVRQDCRGQHLGRLMSLLTLHEFRRTGKSDATLETNDFRLPAIRTYLKLGFEPHCPDEDHRRIWATIMTSI